MFAAGIVSLVAVLLYGRTVGFDFVFDDLALIGLDGPIAVGNGNLPYRPLRYLSYWWDHLLGGGEPWAYHLTNIGLFAGLCVLVVALAVRLGASVRIATLAGLLVATHPLSVECVAYVSGRRDLLVALFGFGALYGWLGFSRRDFSKSLRSSWGPLVLGLLAVASKETGMVYLALLGVLGWFGASDRDVYTLVRLAAVLFAGFLLIYAYGAFGPWLEQIFGWDRVIMTCRMAGHYVIQVFAPVLVMPEYPELLCNSAGCENALGDREFVGLVALGISGWACLYVSRGDNLALKVTVGIASVWLWVVAAVVGLQEPGVDRHALPLLVSLVLLGACGISRFQSTSVALLIGAIVLVLATESLSAIDKWRTDKSLWLSVAEHTSKSVRANQNLARIYASEKKFAKARKHLKLALRQAPNDEALLLAQAMLACHRDRTVVGRRYLSAAFATGDANEAHVALERECRTPNSESIR